MSTGVWKKLIPALMDDFEVFKISLEKIIVDVVNTARELEWEVEPADVTAALQSHDKTWTAEELFHRDKQRNWFLEMEFTAGKVAVKTAEMTTKD